jgi:hypothetical protein
LPKGTTFWSRFRAKRWRISWQRIEAVRAAGKHQVEVEDFDFSYGLYADGRRVICFAEGRIGYREWARRNGRLGDIHSLDDRYDHDIDELLA